MHLTRYALIPLVMGLVACGGGGGGDTSIQPFWTHSGIVVADFDGDGRADVAVATAYVAGPPPHAGFVQVYLQTASGVFSEPTRYAVAPDPWGLSAGDFDGDGRLDLVAATPATQPPQPGVTGSSGEISLLRQDPARAGVFLAALRAATGGAATDAAIAELTGDLRADVIVADGVIANARALLLAQDATAPGALSNAAAIPAGHGSQDLAVGDLNGDGRADVALATAEGVAVLLSNVAGGFDPVLFVPAGIHPQGVAVADIDGDGHADIVVANAGHAPDGGSGGASVTLLRQTAPGQFTASSVVVPDGARRLAVADLNGDSVPDLAVVSLVYQSLSTPSRISVLLQASDRRGELAVSGIYDGPFSGDFIAIGDANADGRNDIFVDDGPVVLLQRATGPGSFDPPKALR